MQVSAVPERPLLKSETEQTGVGRANAGEAADGLEICPDIRDDCACVPRSCGSR
jgi:hypothetical protein